MIYLVKAWFARPSFCYLKYLVLGSLILTLASCQEKEVVEYRFEERLSKGFNYELEKIDSFLIPKSITDEIAFGRLANFNDSLIYLGIGSATRDFHIYHFAVQRFYTVPIDYGLSLSPHLGLSVQDSLLLISNGYEFGVWAFDFSGQVVVSNLRQPIMLPSKHYCVVAHFDFYNDTHLNDGKRTYFRIGRHSTSTGQKEFYTTPAYIRLDSLNQNTDFSFFFDYPSSYSNASEYHQRDFALSSAIGLNGELVISIPRDSCLYVLGNGEPYRVLAKSRYHQENMMIPWGASLAERKNVMMKDNFYTFLFYNPVKKEYYRFFNWSNDLIDDSGLGASWSILVLDSSFNMLGEFLVPDHLGFSMEKAFVFEGKLVLLKTSESDEYIHFSQLDLKPSL